MAKMVRHRSPTNHKYSRQIIETMRILSFGKKVRAVALGLGFLTAIPSHSEAPEERASSAISHAQSAVSHDHVHDEVALEAPTGRPVARLALLGAELVIRTGDPPLLESAPDCGLLLARLLAGQESVPVVQSGSAGHYRIKDSEGRVLLQGRIAQSDDGDETAIIVENNVCVTGGVLAISPAI